jgi:hypothetical protein
LSSFQENIMHRRSFLLLAALALPLLSLIVSSTAVADDIYRMSGPVTHENLAVYFVHGASGAGAVPLTLAEALATKAVRVYETGSLNALAIENVGDQEVFVQSGDIVKGGQQDRVLSVSLVLPPRSGSLPIEAFCVEPGRWSMRGTEDAGQFDSATAALPSRDAKLAFTSVPMLGLMGPVVRAYPNGGAATELYTHQLKVWDEVARVQRALSDRIGAPVTSSQSPTSLQLALENDRLRQFQKDYIATLKPAGEKEADIIGYVFVVNGKLNSAELYASNALFRKMWEKLLTANATEAIAANNEPSATTPSIAALAAFLKTAEGGAAIKQTLTPLVELEIRNSEQALYLETRRADGTWVHRSYVAK